MIHREIKISRIQNAEGEYCWHIIGTEDFSIEELENVQLAIARITYTDTVNLNYFANQLRDDKLFKGVRNNAIQQ